MSEDTRSTQKISTDQMAELQKILEDGAELTITVGPDILARISELIPIIEESEGLEDGSLSIDAGATRILMVGLDVLEG